MVSNAQTTQNDVFASSMQYLKLEVSDEADFLHAEKHEILLQTDTMILIGMVNHSQSSQNSKFAMSYNISKRKLEIEVGFLHADKHYILTKSHTLCVRHAPQHYFSCSHV